jgi:biopolymer transport protein TolR
LPRLQAISSGNKDLRVYVRGDKDVPYGIVLDTIAKIKKSGFKKVALVAKLKES